MKTSTQSNQNVFSEKEKEIISLSVLVETIESILNSTLFELLGADPESQVMFHNELHQKYFYIIMVDFLSKTTQVITGQNGNCIELLEYICKNPNFDQNNSISNLKKSKNIFKTWIETMVTIEVWLPSINKQCSLELTREEFIKICGNISKHHFARLSGVAKKICEIFKNNNIEITLFDSLELLDDFYERFHNDILNYHGSNIAEMFNNVLWGIYEYLLPEFNKYSIKNSFNSQKLSNSCKYPKEINVEFAKKCYLDLLNFIRKKPYVRKFKSTKWLKLRY